MNKLTILSIAILLLTSMSLLYTKEKNRSKKSNLAYNFTTQALFPSGEVKKISLSDYKDKNKVVLYFYPKNGTPTCTKQAKIFRDNFKLLQKHNIIVIGISYDSIKSHKKFQKDNKLPFILATDPYKKITKAFETSGYFFPDRKTVLIDEKGIIVKKFESIDIKTQVTDILKAFHIS